MTDRMISLTLVEGGAEMVCRVAVGRAVIAGWTGRDPAAVEKHIAELEALGVARPPSVPVFYRVAAARLTTADEIEVSGADSGGEVEFVLLRHASKLWVGVGSDHTDRAVETYNVTVSKQMCDKPIAPVFWNFDEVAAHWDRLVLRSWSGAADESVLYQEGPVTAMRTPDDLIARFGDGAGLAEGTLMFGGTLPAIGGVRPTAQFAFEIEDPVLGRKIHHRYATRQLPLL